MELDSFLTEQNITRYRKLLDSSTDETERQTIIELLAEEKAKLKHLPNKFREPVMPGACNAGPSYQASDTCRATEANLMLESR